VMAGAVVIFARLDAIAERDELGTWLSSLA
jgi:hypothetical protein